MSSVIIKLRERRP